MPVALATEVNPQHKRAMKIVKGTATYEDRFVPRHEELVEIISYLRSMGCIIAFTAGNWDLFHLGHVLYIEQGKEGARKHYPDAEHIVMVIGVDTDEMTRKRKGPRRPIVPETERCRVLGGLRGADIVTLQYEPDQLFKLIKHHVRIISTSTQDLPELEMIQAQCEHLVNLPPQAETSTTARIRSLTLDGGLDVFERMKERMGAVMKELADEFGIELKS